MAAEVRPDTIFTEGAVMGDLALMALRYPFPETYGRGDTIARSAGRCHSCHSPTVRWETPVKGAPVQEQLRQRQARGAEAKACCGGRGPTLRDCGSHGSFRRPLPRR